MDHWVAFARQGNPALPGGLQWPLYDAQSRQTMELGPESRLVSDPLGEQRRAWGEQLPSKDSAWQLLQKNH
jgi:para-nitrobenzyl esterase